MFFFLSILNIDNPNKPFAKLMPFSPLLVLEYNPKDSNILASGLMTGQVGFWDIRKGHELIDTSEMQFSHRDPCDKLLWIASKTGTEFFSASKDGQVCANIYIQGGNIKYVYVNIRLFMLLNRRKLLMLLHVKKFLKGLKD